MLFQIGSVLKYIFAQIFFQIFASSGPILSDITSGAVIGYSAVLIPQLEINESRIQILQEEASWIGTLFRLLVK